MAILQIAGKTDFLSRPPIRCTPVLRRIRERPRERMRIADSEDTFQRLTNAIRVKSSEGTDQHKVDQILRPGVLPSVSPV